MTTNYGNTITSTPRRNPKRICSREIPWKINGEDSDNESNDSFVIVKETAENDDIYTPPPMTVLDVCKIRSLQGLHNEEKKFTPRSRRSTPQKYEPENDALIHSGKIVKYNSDHLKKRIKHFMKSAGVPDYKRAMKSLSKRKPVVKRRQPYKKREKHVPQEPDPEVVDVGDNPHYGCSPPGRIKAMLYARRVLQRIRAKRKYLLSLNDENTRYSADTPMRSDPPHALGAPEQNPADLTNNMQACSSTTTEKLQGHCSGNIESDILKGVTAFVDVISCEDENVSGVVRKELIKLGATVVPTFTKKEPVSVVLFNDGHVSTYNKAKKRGIPLVSVLWIEECRKTGVQAAMSKFPASKMERYECPQFVNKIKKRKFLYTGGRIVPRKTRNRTRKPEAPVEDPEPKLETATTEFTSRVDPGPAWLQKYQSKIKGLKILVDLTGVNEEQFKEMMNEPEDSEKYELSPLPMRLLYRIAKDLNNSRDMTPEKESSSSVCTSGCTSDDSKSLSISTLASPLDDKSFEVTEDNICVSLDGNKSLSNLNSEEKSLKSTPKRRYPERNRSVKRKLTY